MPPFPANIDILKDISLHLLCTLINYLLHISSLKNCLMNTDHSQFNKLGKTTPKGHFQPEKYNSLSPQYDMVLYFLYMLNI